MWAVLTIVFPTPATTSVTWDKRWISAISTCLVTRDGRIDRNSTVYRQLRSHQTTRCPVYQRIWPGLDRPGSSLGKPEIPWTPNIASGYGFKAENRARKKVWYINK